MTINRHDVEWHALDVELDEERGADVGDPPELHLARPDLHYRVHLAIDRDDFAIAARLGMLDEEESLRQAPHDREESLEAVDDEPARHATQHLLGDGAMRARVIPEQAAHLCR